MAYSRDYEQFNNNNEQSDSLQVEKAMKNHEAYDNW